MTGAKPIHFIFQFFVSHVLPYCGQVVICFICISNRSHHYLYTQWRLVFPLYKMWKPVLSVYTVNANLTWTVLSAYIQWSKSLICIHCGSQSHQFTQWRTTLSVCTMEARLICLQRKDQPYLFT